VKSVSKGASLREKRANVHVPNDFGEKGKNQLGVSPKIQFVVALPEKS
jgi:hypothetical protein